MDISNENVYNIYKGDHPDSGTNHFLKLPHVPDQPPLFVSSKKKKLPIVAQVFFGAISLIGLYIVYRLLNDSKRK